MSSRTPQTHSGSGDDRSFDVVLLYDNDAALQRAMRTAGHLNGGSEAVRSLNLRTWSFESLVNLQAGPQTEISFASADIIIVAARQGSPAPIWLGEFLGRCLQMPRRASIPLVALGVISSAQSLTELPHTFFETIEPIAEHLGMRFFHSTVSIGEKENRERLEHAG